MVIVIHVIGVFCSVLCLELQPKGQWKLQLEEKLLLLLWRFKGLEGRMSEVFVDTTFYAVESHNLIQISTFNHSTSSIMSWCHSMLHLYPGYVDCLFASAPLPPSKLCFNVILSKIFSIMSSVSR